MRPKTLTSCNWWSRLVERGQSMPFLAFPKQLGKAWGKLGKIGNHPQVTVVLSPEISGKTHGKPMGKTQSPMIHLMIFPSIPCKNCNFKGYTVYVILRPISWTGRWHKLGPTDPTKGGNFSLWKELCMIGHDFCQSTMVILLSLNQSNSNSHLFLSRSFSPRRCSLHPFGSPIVTTWPGALVFPRWFRRYCSRWCSHWRRWSGCRRCTPSPGATARIWRRWDFSTRTRGDGMELGSEKSWKYFIWMETKAWHAICVAWTMGVMFSFLGEEHRNGCGILGAGEIEGNVCWNLGGWGHFWSRKPELFFLDT